MTMTFFLSVTRTVFMLPANTAVKPEFLMPVIPQIQVINTFLVMLGITVVINMIKPKKKTKNFTLNISNHALCVALLHENILIPRNIRITFVSRLDY